MLIAHCSLLPAQDFDNYERIQSEAPIPDYFLMSARERYDQDLNTVSKAGEQGEREAKTEFFAESAYYLNQLLESGKVMFNDPVTRYIERVADELLRHKPALRKQLHFHLVRSEIPNAFATQNGLILINMGLMERFENEAQLAFVLCHEISHYVKQHPLKLYLHSQKKRKIFDTDEGLSLRNQYSREKEEEADILGLQLFMESKYSIHEVAPIFDILKKSRHPFTDEKFSRYYLEPPTVHFPEAYYLDSITPIQAESPYSTLGSFTHPAPDERKELLQVWLENKSNEGRKKFIQNEFEFYDIRKICRFECAFLFLLNRKYERALYQAFLLSKWHPESLFLQKITVQALYALSRYNDEVRLWDIHPSHEEVEGASQQLYFEIEQFQASELNALAIFHNYDFLEKNKNDLEASLMLDELLQARFIYYEGKPSQREKSSDFSEKILTLLRTKKHFEAAWQKQRSIVQADSSILVFKTSANTTNNPKSTHLHLDSINIVNPFYRRLDHRKRESLQYLASESGRESLLKSIENQAERLAINAHILSHQNLKESDISQHRDMAVLAEWIREKNALRQMSLVSIQHQEAIRISEKYKSPYFVWTGAMSVTHPKKQKFMKLLIGLPVLPYAIYSAYKGKNEAYFYTVVYDLKAGKSLGTFSRYLGLKDRADLIDAVIYDILWQIK